MSLRHGEGRRIFRPLLIVVVLAWLAWCCLVAASWVWEAAKAVFE